jgi:hypothetical protein
MAHSIDIIPNYTKYIHISNGRKMGRMVINRILMLLGIQMHLILAYSWVPTKAVGSKS